MKTVEITITTSPTNEEVGHEAIVACKPLVATILEALKGLGLEAKESRRLVSRRAEKKSSSGPKLVA